MKIENIGDEELFKELIYKDENGKATLKCLHEISNAMMDSLYIHKYDIYDNERLDEAEKFFHFLCIYDFYNTQYIMGLAGVYRLKKQFKKAIELYVLAFALDDSDYRSVFYTGQCHMFMNKTNKAKECFELVYTRSQDMILRKKAQFFLAALLKSNQKLSFNDTKIFKAII
ncbi:type III secretion system translocator chaperone SicA [Glaciimonas sp. GG7]